MTSARSPRGILCAAVTILVAGATLNLRENSMAHAESRPSYGGKFVGSLPSEPVSVDPLMANSRAELILAGLAFDSLYRISATGQASPHLALTMPSFDSTGVRITIRTGVVNHDGSLLSVDDVAASLRRALTKRPGLLPGVTSVRTAGGDVVLSMRSVNAELAALLAQPTLSITAGGKPPNPATPIGSGPFAITSVDRTKRRVLLRAHGQHFAGRPYLNELQLDWFGDAAAEARRYETGGAQASARGASVFVGHSPRYATVELQGAATNLAYVGFGRSQRAITDATEFRHALDLALGRGSLAGTGYGERLVATRSPLAADLGGPLLPSSEVGGDLTRAKAALERAGATSPALRPAARAGVKLRIIIDATRFDDRELAERVLRALDKLGLSAAITELDAATFASNVASGACDLYLGEQGSSSPSATITWLQAFEAGGDSWARTRLASGALDLGLASTTFAKTLPIIPLVHRSVRYQLRHDLRGATVDLLGRLGLADAFYFGKPRAGS